MLILYGSKYGTAQRYAEEFARLVGESAHPVREKLAPPQDGVTVFFGAVYVGKVHGLKRAVRLAARGERLFAVVTVGLADADESYRKQLEASVRAACPERLLPRLKQYRLRGRLNEPALKGGDKFLLRLLHTAAEKTPASEQTPEMRALLAAPAALPDLAPLKELKGDMAEDISPKKTHQEKTRPRGEAVATLLNFFIRQ